MPNIKDIQPSRSSHTCDCMSQDIDPRLMEAEFRLDMILPDETQRKWNRLAQDLNEAMKMPVTGYYF